RAAGSWGQTPAPGCTGAFCDYASGSSSPSNRNRDMSLALKVTVAGLAALSAVACSSTPKQVTAPAVTAAPATSAAADATQVNSKLLGQGYKPVKVKNELVYCRMEAMTGTQFKKRVCLTEAAI